MKFFPTFALVAALATSAFCGDKVILGESCALSGPAKDLGTEMNLGAAAFFKTSPDVELKVKDDKYEPVQCEANTKAFLADKVTALFGYVGTPTAKVATPLAMEAKTIFFGAFTGAGFLSDAKANPYAFSLRASYDAETQAMVEHLVLDLGIKEIGLFIQDDAYGEAGKSGVDKAVAKLAGQGVKVVAEGRYARNTLAVKDGADKITAAGAKAVIMIGAYMPCAAAIKYWKKAGFQGPFLNVSFVGSAGLAESIKSDSKNVVISQVVPLPWDKSVPVVAEYQKAMGGKGIGFGTLEGYLAAKTLHMAIDKSAKPVTSETIKTALESMSTFDLGGLPGSFGPTDHRGLKFTSLTKINPDGTFSVIKSLKDL